MSDEQSGRSKKPERTPEEKAAARARQIANLRPWGPDNPPPKSAGRPKGVREAFLAATDNGADVIRTLVDLMKHAERESVRHDAAKTVGERIWGRPVETQVLLDATQAAGAGLTVDPHALEALARALLPGLAPGLAPGQTLARLPETVDAAPISAGTQNLDSDAMRQLAQVPESTEPID
jgi:hypothetical protein